MTEIITVPLNKLDADPMNVRKTYSTESIEGLATSLLAKGQLQNIVIRKAPKGRFFVTAGGRRHTAFLLLAERGQIAKDFGINAIVKQAEEATEISLAENVMREDMLGSLSQLSCWVRTAVMVVGDIRGAYRGRHTDVRVKRSRSVARTTLDAAATPQAC